MMRVQRCVTPAAAPSSKKRLGMVCFDFDNTITQLDTTEVLVEACLAAAKPVETQEHRRNVWKRSCEAYYKEHQLLRESASQLDLMTFLERQREGIVRL